MIWTRHAADAVVQPTGREVAGEAAVGVRHAAGQQALGHVRLELGEGRVAGEIIEFARVVLEIEEQGRQSREVDVFPTLGLVDGEAALVHLDAEALLDRGVQQLAEVELVEHAVAPAGGRRPQVLENAAAVRRSEY